MAEPEQITVWLCPKCGSITQAFSQEAEPGTQIVCFKLGCRGLMNRHPCLPASEVRELEARERRLREALIEAVSYAGHMDGCASRQESATPGLTRCNCGWDESVASWRKALDWPSGIRTALPDGSNVSANQQRRTVAEDPAPEGGGSTFREALEQISYRERDELAERGEMTAVELVEIARVALSGGRGS